MGLSAADVTTAFAHPAAAPAVPTQHFWTMNLSFPNHNFTREKTLRFNNGRSVWQDATTPQGTTASALRRRNEYSVDLLGGTPFIPEDPNGTSVASGMSFSATIVDGANTYPISGRLTNKIGHGWTPLDGFGFINAEAAVSAP